MGEIRATSSRDVTHCPSRYSPAPPIWMHPTRKIAATSALQRREAPACRCRSRSLASARRAFSGVCEVEKAATVLLIATCRLLERRHIKTTATGPNACTAKSSDAHVLSGRSPTEPAR
jgi:hypothetical protein